MTSSHDSGKMSDTLLWEKLPTYLIRYMLLFGQKNNLLYRFFILTSVILGTFAYPVFANYDTVNSSNQSC